MKNKATSKQLSEFIVGIILIVIIIICVKLIGIEFFPESSVQNSTISDKEKIEETLKSVKLLSDSMEKLDKEIDNITNNTKYNTQLPVLYAALTNAVKAYNQECLIVESFKNRHLSDKELNKKLTDALDVISLGLCSKASAYEHYAKYVNSRSVKSSSEAMVEIANADKMLIMGITQVISIAKELGIKVE